MVTCTIIARWPLGTPGGALVPPASVPLREGDSRAFPFARSFRRFQSLDLIIGLSAVSCQRVSEDLMRRREGKGWATPSRVRFDRTVIRTLLLKFG